MIVSIILTHILLWRKKPFWCHSPPWLIFFFEERRIKSWWCGRMSKRTMQKQHYFKLMMMIQRQKITSYVSRTSQTNTLALPIDNNNTFLYIFLIYGVFINKSFARLLHHNKHTKLCKRSLLKAWRNNIHNNKSVQKTT